MPKKIIKHQRIPDEKQRKKVHKNRSEGLVKKVEQLSILCGIDAAVVIHKRNEVNASLWPSPEIYMDRMQKFLNFSAAERERKMATHEKILEQRVMEESRNLFKLQRTNELLEGELVTDDLTSGKISFEQLHLIHMNNLKLLADDMLESIDKIICDNQNGSEQQLQQQPPTATSFVKPPPIPNLSPIEDLLRWSDEWLDDETMMSEQGGVAGFMGFEAEINNARASSSNIMNTTPPPTKD